jgi:hypothetical protein
MTGLRLNSGNRSALLTGLGLFLLVHISPAYAGRADFVLVSRREDGVAQAVNLSYQEEEHLVLTSDGENQGTYVTSHFSLTDKGSYLCQPQGCGFSGALHEWGAGRLDDSRTYLQFSYSSGGHQWVLKFRRVRLICPGMYPFC